MKNGSILLSLTSLATLHLIKLLKKKMDHFEKGLKGNIKSMIAAHAFDSHQEMYQRAIKIAQVLNEAEGGSRAVGQTKGKFEYGR